MGLGLRWGRALFLAPLFIAITVLAVAAAPREAAALDGEEQAFLGLINQYRAANGLSQLGTGDQLTAASLWMSQDMGANAYFSHTDSLGRDPFQRMADFGYNYNTWKGENLAAGAQSAQQAFDLWKGSPGHDTNMKNANFNFIGIGRVYVNGSPFGWYWTTDFGGQADGGAPPPPPPPAPTPKPVPIPVTTPVPTPMPTPVPTPEPTPVPTPEPTPVPPPQWQEIASQVEPWWQRLMVVEGDGSLLRSLSYMAETYLESAGTNLVHESGSDDDAVRSSLSDHLWPRTLS